MSYKTIRTLLVALVLMSGAYLVIDHGEHLAPYLPFAFLLGCLFMHLFHGSHARHSEESAEK